MTGRLIDADRMKDNIKVGDEKVNSRNIDYRADCVVKPKVLIEWIDSQPTVEAIPIDWIIGWSETKLDYIGHQILINDMLLTWKNKSRNSRDNNKIEVL